MVIQQGFWLIEKLVGECYYHKNTLNIFQLISEGISLISINPAAVIGNK
jgi:hypothetical protein